MGPAGRMRTGSEGSRASWQAVEGTKGPQGISPGASKRAGPGRHTFGAGIPRCSFGTPLGRDRHTDRAAPPRALECFFFQRTVFPLQDLSTLPTRDGQRGISLALAVSKTAFNSQRAFSLKLHGCRTRVQRPRTWAHVPDVSLSEDTTTTALWSTDPRGLLGARAGGDPRGSTAGTFGDQ